MTSPVGRLIVPQGRARELHGLFLEDEHLMACFLAVQKAKQHTKHPEVLGVLKAQEVLLLRLMRVYLHEIVDVSARHPTVWIFPIKDHHEGLWEVFQVQPSSRLFRHLDRLKQRRLM